MDSLGHLTSRKELDGTHWVREVDRANWKRELEGDRPKISAFAASGGLEDEDPEADMAAFPVTERSMEECWR